jgi:quercetin dioxygenase-like cupin family protein
MMMRHIAIFLLVFGLFPGLEVAQGAVFKPVLPSSLRWESPPDTPGLQRSWVIGSERKSGKYILRVRLLSGTRILPHAHPDERVTTVLTGTVFIGFGKRFDASRVIAMPAGAVYITPAHVPHYIWAKGGNTVFQESGTGPTRTIYTGRLRS